MAKLCDVGAHLVSWQLPSFTRFGALGDLDLQLVRVSQIVDGHTKAPRSDLLDGRAPLVHEARWILAPLAGVGLAA